MDGWMGGCKDICKMDGWLDGTLIVLKLYVLFNFLFGLDTLDLWKLFESHIWSLVLSNIYWQSCKGLLFGNTLQ